LALVALVYLGGGWYFSGEIQSRALDGAARRASTLFDPDLTVKAIGGGTVTLAPIEEPPNGLATEGVWGLRWEVGYGQVGRIVDRAGDRVERELTLLDGELPAVGAEAELDTRSYPDPETAGLAVEDVRVEGPLGEYPAWFVDAEGPTWVVAVHGNSMSRLDVVRVLPTLRDAEYPSLTISIRNDPGAPEDPSGLLRFGLTEWRDLEAAVRHALAAGSEGVVLLGYSMGGGVIGAFLERSPLADEVRAVVLDAPMLNFSETVDDNATRERVPLIGTPLPPGLISVAKFLADLRYDVRWSELDYLDQPEVYDMPVLVFHGTEDDTVPVGTSDELKRLVPAVRLIRCEGADHTQCWNLDPQAYQTQVTTFLDEAIS
jgi:pimeloyl-ACP methyl ester carboxylesterase